MTKLRTPLYVLALIAGCYAVARWSTCGLFDAGVSAAAAGGLLIGAELITVCELRRERMRAYRFEVWLRRIEEARR